MQALRGDARLHPGKTRLTLYRGVNRMDEYDTLATPDNKQRIVLLNSLNSFATHRERTDEFGNRLLTVDVSLAKVFCYSGLLPGMPRGEDEYTVIGRVYEAQTAAY